MENIFELSKVELTRVALNYLVPRIFVYYQMLKDSK